jgi:hypothetical protein
MKKIFLIFILSSFNCLGQDISEINKKLNISDTIQNEKEIRIYKEIRNYISCFETDDSYEIFRMYERGKNDWNVFIYKYNSKHKTITKIEQIEFPKDNLGKLKSKNANLIWLDILMCNTEFLPSIHEIKYKLSKKSIELVGVGEYGIDKSKTKFKGGVYYTVLLKNEIIKNDFVFDNIDFYIKEYPDVDELISYSQLIEILKREFNF